MIRKRSWSAIFHGEFRHLVVLSVVIGLLGGVGAFAFCNLIWFFQNLCVLGSVSSKNTEVVEILRGIPWVYLLFLPAIGGALVGPLVYFFAREAKGHGVPEVIEAVALNGGKIRPRLVVVKAIASAITLGTGGSAGREGPIVQIGSSLGSSVAQLLGLDRRDRKLLLGCGAAAGIAATFNAPMAGILFAVEVILRYANIRNMTPLVVSSVLATVTSRALLGDSHSFELPPYQLVSPQELALYALLGILAGALGVVLTRGLYFTEDRFDDIPIPEYCKPALGGLLLGAILIYWPEVYGPGYHVIERMVTGHAGWEILGMLIVVKLAATWITLGSGGSGGVFSPSLFLGCMLGGAFGGIAHEAFPAWTAPGGTYAIVGMAAMVASTTRAPVTSIIILFEMTGNYAIILPLMLTVGIATLVSHVLCTESIYTMKLARRGTDIGSLGLDDLLRATSVEYLVRPVDRTLCADASFRTVAETLLESRGHHVYIVDKQEKFQGGVALDDIKGHILTGNLDQLAIAQDLMDGSLVPLSHETSLLDAFHAFADAGMDELPVIGAEGGLLGLLSERDLVRFYDDHILRMGDKAIRFFVDAIGEKRTGVVDLPPGHSIEVVPIPKEFVGKTLTELSLRATCGVNVVAIRRHFLAGVGNQPEPDRPLEANSFLVVTGPAEGIKSLSVESAPSSGPNSAAL